MALINRDVTLERMKSMAGCATCDNYNYVRCRACSWDDAMNIVEEMAEVDAAPVVHARWLYEHGDSAMLPCSACGYEVYRYNNTPYCPRCGAKMDGERRDSE